MELLHPLFASLTITMVLALVVIAVIYAMNYLLALENLPEASPDFTSHAATARPAQTRYAAANDELIEDELIDAVRFTYRSLTFYP